MSDPLAAEVTALKAKIVRVLTGELTEDDEPSYFDDDVFFCDVRRLEELDRVWLDTVLRDRTYSRDTRGLVAIQMTNQGHKHLIVELFAERASN